MSHLDVGVQVLHHLGPSGVVGPSGVGCRPSISVCRTRSAAWELACSWGSWRHGLALMTRPTGCQRVALLKM